MQPLLVSLLLSPAHRLDEQHLRASLADVLGPSVRGLDALGFGYGWGIGSVTGTETLVQSRPIFRGAPTDFTDALLRPPGDASIAIIAGRDGPSARLPEFARFHRWICAASCPDFDRPSSPLRDRFMSGFSKNFPEFIKRSESSSSTSESLMFATLSVLHERHQLGAAPSSSQDILDALVEVDLRLGLNDHACDLLLLDGSTVAGRCAGPTRITTLRPSDTARASEVAGAVLVSGGAEHANFTDGVDVRDAQGPSAGTWWAVSIHEPGRVLTAAAAADETRPSR